MQVIEDIKKNLDESATTLFESTIFGSWLQLESFEKDPLLVNAVLQSEIYTVDTDRAVFSIGGNEMTFTREAFCLITGMRFGDNHGVYPCFGTSFLSRVSPKPKTVKDVMDIVSNPSDYKNMATGDSVRLCLLLLAHRGFLGRESTTQLIEPFVALVENLDAWNTYPWGSVCWKYLIPSIRGRVVPKEVEHRKYFADTGKLPQYSLLGFYFAFTVICDLKKICFFIFTILYRYLIIFVLLIDMDL